MNTIQLKQKKTTYPISLKDSVEFFSKQLFFSLFDEEYQLINRKSIEENFIAITLKLSVPNSKKLWDIFLTKLITIKKLLILDAKVALKKDPAAKSLDEVFLAYPGFHAIATYRLSHELLKLNIPILPRMMSEYAHSVTGTDIHPAAEIGESFFIDHATGIVIGETSIIKNNVTIYQGVTLGGLQIKKSLSTTKRHPTIENNVTIYANATILGGNITIGANSIIGANVWITKSIAKNSLVTYHSEINIKSRT